MYYLYNGHSYIGMDSNNIATSVSNIENAHPFSDSKKATNYKNNLKTTLRKFNWQVVKIDEEPESVEENCENNGEYIYVETQLEKSGFDISKFFNEAVKTASQLKVYANNMMYLEREYDKKILDVRHYIRDEKTKLNAVQMQRIGSFLQQLERERYKCKSNRTIAGIFLNDWSRLENPTYLEVIKHVKESEYEPRILTYELLDEIVGKKKRQKEENYEQ